MIDPHRTVADEPDKLYKNVHTAFIENARDLYL